MFPWDIVGQVYEPMTSSKKKNQVKNKLTRQRVQVGLLVLLGILIVNQTIQFYRYKDELALLSTLDSQNSALIQDLSQSQELLSMFGQDLNDIRSFLLLPTKRYEVGDLNESVLLAEEEEEDISTQLFTYVEKLGTYEANQERYEANRTLFTAALAEPYWTERGLLVDVAGQQGPDALIFSFKDPSLENTLLFEVELGYDGIFSLSALDEDWVFEDSTSGEQVLKELKAYVDTGLNDLRDQYITLQTMRTEAAALLATPTVQEALAVQGLNVSTELNSSDKYYYEIKDKDARALVRLYIDKQRMEMVLKLLEAQGDYAEEMVLKEDAITVLVDALYNGLDVRTATQKLVDEREQEMESVFADRAFKAVLQELELQMGIKSETELRISYPLLREDGQILRVIYIDKNTGEVNVELPDGAEVQTLSMAIEAIDLTGKKKLSTPPYC